MEYKVGEYYWLKIKGLWEVCLCFSFTDAPDGVMFEIMGVEFNAYNVNEIEEARLIERPT